MQARQAMSLNPRLPEFEVEVKARVDFEIA